MSTVTASEAKTKFGELLDRVASGEEIVITHHDNPVARMVPEGRRSLEAVRQAVAGLRELQQKIGAHCTGKPKLTWADFKSFVHEGRQ